MPRPPAPPEWLRDIEEEQENDRQKQEFHVKEYEIRDMKKGHTDKEREPKSGIANQQNQRKAELEDVGCARQGLTEQLTVSEGVAKAATGRYAVFETVPHRALEQ